MVGSGDHRNVRSPMQWTDGPNAGFTTGVPWQQLNGNYPQYNVLVEQQDPGSLLSWYRQLIDVRNQTPALRRGTHDPLFSSNSAVLAFVRRHETQTVLCLVNTSPYALGGFTLTGSAQSLTPGEHALVNLLDLDDTFDITVCPDYTIDGLSLAGHEVAIYEFESDTDVQPGDSGLPGASLRIERNFPNPFNPVVTIRYTMPMRSHVRLGIYDIAGHAVAVIRDDVQAAGTHEARWHGVDRRGLPLSAGVYFVRLDAGGESRMSKVTLAK